MVIKRYILLCLLIAVRVSAADAQIEQPEYRLTVYEPGYVVWRTGSYDEDAMRAHFSFRYQLWDKNLNKDIEFFKNNQIFASYTGEFDFYVGTRDSGPVVNRINNPALHFRHEIADAEPVGLQWFDLSLEHKSNGQVIEVSNARHREKIALAYAENDKHFFDTISRSSNFVAAQLLYKRHYHLYLKGKLYINEDSDVTWGRWSNTGVSLQDYDRANLIFYDEYFNNKLNLSLSWVVGDQLLKTDSVDLGVTYQWGNFPLLLRIHEGPLFTLSNYTQPDRYIGVGINFMPWK